MHIVLVHPEIPQNTGSIARTCAATKTPLHLVEPMAFEITEKRVRRAGLDYWPYVDLSIHSSWKRLRETLPDARFWFFSKFGGRCYYSVPFSTNDVLVFGSESSGLPPEILANIKPDERLAIPMAEPAVRSLNLSNAVSVALYEARRQMRLDEPFNPRN